MDTKNERIKHGKSIEEDFSLQEVLFFISNRGYYPRCKEEMYAFQTETTKKHQRDERTIKTYRIKLKNDETIELTLYGSENSTFKNWLGSRGGGDIIEWHGRYINRNYIITASVVSISCIHDDLED